MPDLAIVLVAFSGLILGFLAGFATRSLKSRLRYHSAERRRGQPGVAQTAAWR